MKGIFKLISAFVFVLPNKSCIHSAAHRPYNITNCESLYFGLDGDSNHEDAFQCFQKSGHTEDHEIKYLFLTLMSANGEGTKKDYIKAKQFMGEYRKLKLKKQNRAQMKELSKRISELSEKPDTNQKIKYCNDLAINQFELNKCAYITYTIAEIEDKNIQNNLTKSFSKKEKEIFQNLYLQLKNYAEIDSNRLYFEYQNGSIKTIIKYQQKRLIENNFMKVLKEVLVNKRLEAVYPNTFTAEQELLKTLTREMKKAETPIEMIEKSQNAWNAYKDLWIDLLKVHTIPELSKEQAERSMAVILIKKRIEELKNDPFEE